MDFTSDFFAKLRAGQASYMPNDQTVGKLSNKTIVMLVGPAAAGKSTLMNAAVELDPRLHRVPTFTTREHRINDEPGVYHYISTEQEFEKLDSDIANGNVVQYGVSPVKDVVYGTYAADYLREYNLKDVWYSAVAEFEKLNFENKIIVGLVADPADWIEWYGKRFNPDDPEALSRLDEAKQCLPWLLEHPDIKWLQNKNDDIEESALRLIDICLGGQGQADGAQIAQAMLEAIPSLQKSYEDTKQPIN